jgi:DNA-binding transcriptional ArsR family regulator
VETLTHGQVLARFGHALSDATRARVLLALRDAPGYPADLADLLGVSRQRLSNHLACLRGCGLVVAARKAGAPGTSWRTTAYAMRSVTC